MDHKLILNKLESIEKLQGQILYYIHELAEHHNAGKVALPEVVFNDQEVMFKMSWSKSTLKRRRAEGILPFIKVKNKYYYKERDVLNLLFRAGPHPGSLLERGC